MRNYFKFNGIFIVLFLVCIVGGAFSKEITATPPAQTISQENIAHCLQKLNEYRASCNVPPLKLNTKLSDFAYEGSLQLMEYHTPHNHFTNPGDSFWEIFSGSAGENQGDPDGWGINKNINNTIDDILKAMMDEGPGGGHHDNIINPKFKRVGIGLVMDNDSNLLYFTNDFSQ